MYLLIRYLNSNAADIPALPKVRYPRLSSCLAAALSFLPLIGCATDDSGDPAQLGEIVAAPGRSVIEAER